MALTKWRPRTDLLSFRDEINKLFDDFFQGPPARASLWEGAWVPTTDVSETENEFTVKFELPGVSQKDVSISLTDDVLTVKGEKKQETEEKKRNYYRTECSYGAFQRSFRLPVPVKSDEIKATFKNGILEVVIPKAEEVRPKDIQIEVG